MTGRTSTILTDQRLRHFCWARDGRIVYGRLEPPPAETSSNLWEIRVDPRTGKAQGEARRLTKRGGFQFSYPGISDDGRPALNFLTLTLPKRRLRSRTGKQREPAGETSTPDPGRTDRLAGRLDPGQ